MYKKTTTKLLQKVVGDYNNISENFHQTRKYPWEEFNKFLKYIKDEDILTDLGCGNGRFYDFIKQHKKINYIGIDNNKKLLKKAKLNTSKKTSAKFIYGDLLKIPLKETSIDTAVSIASLHHIPSKKLKEKSIKEIKRILKDDGILIITVWNLFQKKYKKYIFQSYLRFFYTLGKYNFRDTFIPWGKTGTKRYYYAFKFKELKKLLEKNNFKILYSHIGNNFLFIAKNLNNEKK